MNIVAQERAVMNYSCGSETKLAVQVIQDKSDWGNWLKFN